VPIGKTTVYIHNNIIEKVDEKGHVYYEYEEIQYSKDEYLKKMSDENEIMKNALDAIIMGV